MNKLIAVILCVCLLCGCSQSLPTPNSFNPIENSTIGVENKSALKKSASSSLPPIPSSSSLPPSNPIDKLIIEESYGKAFYKNLIISQDEKLLYDSLLSAFVSMSTLVEIPALETETIKTIYEYVRLDNPQIYYIPKAFNILKKEGSKFQISLKYGQIPDGSKIKLKTDEILSGLVGIDSEYMRVRYIYKIIVNLATYSVNNEGIQSMLIDGYGSCEGYSELFKYLCDKANVDSIVVTGTSRESAHQWNMVKVLDKWYHIDATWGDPVNGDSNFDYFCLPYKDMLKSHVVDRLELLPVADSADSNYFVQSNLILNTSNEEDIYKIFKLAYSMNPKNVSFRISNQDVFNKTVKTMPDWIYKALKEVNHSGNHITYNTNNDLYIINITIG